MPSDSRAPTEAKSIWDFATEFLVVCPKCSRRAMVRRGDGESAARLSCGACCHVREWRGPYLGHSSCLPAESLKEGMIVLGAPLDPYMHHDLWLRVACTGELLWAYNAQHLAFLRSFVGATLRERPTDAHGFRNRLLESRLPKWMTSAKNRDAVLAGVSKLEQRLLERD